MRPYLRWILFTLCLLVLTGAMGWMSLRMLSMDEQRRRVAEDADVQEKVRLALWRMDSLASALLIRENSRPAYHYQAFYAPDDLFASKTENIPKGQALMPSPLFGSLPDLVQLNFEMLPGQSALCSPQAPMGEQREIATSWYTLSPQTSLAAQKLSTLDALLKKHPEVQKITRSDTRPMIELKPPAEAQEEFKQAAAKENIPLPQALANATEQRQRAMVLDNNIALEKSETYKPQLKKAAPVPSSKKPEEQNMASNDFGKDKKTDAPSGILAEVTSRYRSDSKAPSDREGAKSSTTRQSLPALAGDLQPVWVENELLLLRHATVEGSPRVQGVWLDWPQLQTRLLATIRDLMPAASLVAVQPEVARTDASSLVTLPVKLLTGPMAVSRVPLDSALRPALIIAWSCLVAAALAIAFVLHRAMLLSERRGAFVSAVTHELRTPLTTFRLYSEMLADDMVPDATQRRSYLQTLCDESTRLMHLVENVLAYSRIERGRTAGRMETVKVSSLLDRIVPRLRQRTSQVDLMLIVEAAKTALAQEVRVDAMAVEQILFNLTDNACKYAAPDCDPRELVLKVEQESQSILFTLRDYGPGLPSAQKKRLFQPFSKSATEAAHSAPGVGLGLALSRRLARELEGDLIYRVPEGRGAAFEFRVKSV